MRFIRKIHMQAKLYSFAAPLALLPLMDFSFSEIGDYIRGLEFRSFVADLLIQLTIGLADTAILAVVGAAFGAL